MPIDSREARAEAVQVLLPWGSPLAEGEEAPDVAGLWLAGGASLVLWTAIALLLTAV